MGASSIGGPFSYWVVYGVIVLSSLSELATITVLDILLCATRVSYLGSGNDFVLLL